MASLPFDEKVAEEINNITSKFKHEQKPENPVAGFRNNLHAWKLEEARWYLADGNPKEAHAMLKSAARIRKAMENNESADLPQRGDLIYENSFRVFPTDWKIFGFGDFRCDAERGLYIRPNTTVNLWSEKKFESDYIVDFEYLPEPPAKDGCGTFLQLSANPVLNRNPLDFMASATSRMPDYNFGIWCYHFSFNRNAPKRDRTNFRKTGDAFRLLALTEKKHGSESRWHSVCAVKRGRQFLFFINGNFILEYFDEGYEGPFLDRGRIGLRNWGGMTSWFRNFRVYEIQ